MGNIVFRIDDINPNTDLDHLLGLIEVLRRFNCVIIGCFTIFGKNYNLGTGQVYDGEVPFKHKETKWFYDVNGVLTPKMDILGIDKVASHGLIHCDHSKLDRPAQEMSILTSCSYLKCRMFVAPFNKYNIDTEQICCENRIQFVTNRDWLSLEFNEFDPLHTHWYLHPWRWDRDSLCQKLLTPGTVTSRR